MLKGLPKKKNNAQHGITFVLLAFVKTKMLRYLNAVHRFTLPAIATLESHASGLPIRRCGCINRAILEITLFLSSMEKLDKASYSRN
jgi:hypothetical protein